ncbi:hypothetical protein ABPG74_010711 [Tetrahymena malaccensis]
MSEFFLNLKCKKQIKDCEYEVKAQVPLHKNCLQFEIRSTTDPWVWKNEFSAQYIEDLTEKTGQKKSFFEFLNLIDESLNQKQTNKSNFDILTYQDLKTMNTKKSETTQPNQLNNTGQSQMNSSTSTQSDQTQQQQQRQNKRYLIISSSSNNSEDKIHYPLSLNGDQVNDPSSLKEIIKNLQKELSKARNNDESLNSSTFYSSNGFDKKQQGSPRSTSGKSFYDPQGQKVQLNKKEYDQIKLENDLLKAKVKRIEDYFSQKQGAIEIEQLIKQKFNLENEIDKQRIISSKRICELEVEVEMKERQLNQKKTENLELQKQLTQIVCESEDTANKRIKAQLLKLTEETEQQLVLSKKTIQKQKQEIDKLTSDAEKFTNEEKKLKQKIAQLEIELTNSQRRSNSRSNPLGARGIYGNSSSHSSINSRRSTPNSHPSKLGYSSPSLQIQNRNRFNRTDGSQSKNSTPNGSKNSLHTPKSQSYSSIRSNSQGNSQNNTPTNSRLQRGINGINSQNNQRNNKFFSNNNPNNNQQSNQSLSQNSSRNNSAGNNNLQNRRQPLYQINNERQNSLTRNNQLQVNGVKNVKPGSIDIIPENGRYIQQTKTNTPQQSSQSSVVSRLYQPKSYNQPPQVQANQRSSSTQRQTNSSAQRLNSSGSNAQQLSIETNPNRKPLNTSYNSMTTPSSKQSTQSNARTPQNPTQPRYVPANNYMKPLNKNQQNQKVGYQPNQLRQHAQIQEKIDQALFDDKHILNNQPQAEGKSELELKIDKLQNILQSAKDMTVDEF